MPTATTVERPELAYRTVEEFDQWRAVVTVVAGGMITLLTIAAMLFGNFLAGLATFVVLSVLFLADSFHRADPKRVDKIMPIVRAAFVNKLYGPGWVYIPLTTLLSFLFGYETVNGQDINFGFDVEEILPGDQSQIALHNFFYVIINPDDPIRVVDIGGLDKVFERLHQQVEQRERNWARSETEGPQTLDHALGMKDEAIHAILQMLLEDSLRSVAPDIPSEAILGYIKRRPLSAKEQEWITKFKEKDATTQDEILRAGEDLLKFIQGARNGEVSIAMHDLGLIIRRFGVDSIRPVGTTPEDLEEVRKAKFTARKRRIDAEGLRDAGKVIAKAPGFKGDSVQAVMIAEGIVKKTVTETETGVADPVLETAKVLFQPIIAAVASRIAGGKE